VIYSRLPSFILGFHGCDAALAERVIAGRAQLKFSRNEYDSLGSGIYFWEHSPLRAMEWARELRRLGKVRRPAVVGAVIDLGECLNLLDRRYIDVVKVAHGRLVSACQIGGAPLPANRRIRGRSDLLLRNLDCATINTAHELRREGGLPPFDSVRAAFIEGEPLYPNAGFNDRNHIQICVCNADAIKGYFRPMRRGEWSS
jgi:hypothetical protein